MNQSDRRNQANVLLVYVRLVYVEDEKINELVNDLGIRRIKRLWTFDFRDQGSIFD